MKCIRSLLVITMVLAGFGSIQAQQLDEKSPSGAMLRSLVMPGWGQYYTNSSDWNRGRAHFIADIALIGGYFGVTLNANRLEINRNTFAQQHAGANLDSRGRNYRLNVSEFNSIYAYNDYQERTRNWDRIINNTDELFWQWDSESNRREFMSLNNRIDQNRQQLPAIASLMIVNRVIAGIHAYANANSYNQSQASLTFTIPYQTGGQGIMANFQLNF
ncbi:MAG: DUF5683 domain-containing protein [Balneolales bacterium]|nr:DUF5683 domain-containing protein [Balneolales bacterium]